MVDPDPRTVMPIFDSERVESGGFGG